MDKVCDVIQRNRQHKLTKHKKLSNNTIIEIDSCSPLELLQLQVNLTRIASGEGILFKSGKGKKKSQLQQLHEELEACGNRLLKYKEYYENLGTNRNSYPKDVTADSGYSSEKNLIYLKDKGIEGYIKLQLHDKMKTRAYQDDIGKHYSMMYMVDDASHYYRCHDGRHLDYIRSEASPQDGYTRMLEVYACDDCTRCEHKASCLYRYNEKIKCIRNKIKYAPISNVAAKSAASVTCFSHIPSPTH